jgi:hypothetical protein
MKKTVFKWVTTIIDYTSEEEAKKDIARMKKNKGIFIKSEGWTSNGTFEEYGKGERCYTVEVYTPYSDKYNTGY